MFLNKIRNNFCVPDTKFVSATNGETFVSATMCPQQCALVCQGLKSGSGVMDLSRLGGYLPHFRPCADTLENSSFQIFK